MSSKTSLPDARTPISLAAWRRYTFAGAVISWLVLFGAIYGRVHASRFLGHAHIFGPPPKWLDLLVTFTFCMAIGVSMVAALAWFTETKQEYIERRADTIMRLEAEQARIDELEAAVAAELAARRRKPAVSAADAK